MAIDENVIAFMLEARERFGPIGGHCETLYRERKGEELYTFVKSLAERGVPEMGMFLEGDAAREMFVARLPVALASHAASPPTFCLLPIGVLTGFQQARDADLHTGLNQAAIKPGHSISSSSRL